MTVMAMYYCGVRLVRLVQHGEATGAWVLPCGRVMGWNAALAWVDSVCEGDGAPERALPPFYCDDCGARDLLEGYSCEVQEQAGLCRTCLHWTDFAANQKREPWRYFVHRGEAYRIDGRGKVGSGFLGFAGAEWVIAWPDGHVEATNNLWHVGDVPRHWRGRLPDTAVRNYGPAERMSEAGPSPRYPLEQPRW